MNTKKLSLIALFCIILGGSLALFAILGTPTQNPKTPIVTGNDYKSITYSIEEMSITLKAGQAEVAHKDSEGNIIETQKYAYFGNEVQGDFNNDGNEDVAFLLTTQGAGTGTFYYLVAALKGPDGYTGTRAIFIGDRIAPQTTEFKEGRIIINYADRKLDEPMTATPSVGVTKYFVIENGELKSNR